MWEKRKNFVYNKLHEHERKLEFFPKSLSKASVSIYCFFHWIFHQKTHTHTHTNFTKGKLSISVFVILNMFFGKSTDVFSIFYYLAFKFPLFMLWSFWIIYELRQIKTLESSKEVFGKAFVKSVYWELFLVLFVAIFY